MFLVVITCYPFASKWPCDESTYQKCMANKPLNNHRLIVCFQLFACLACYSLPFCFISHSQQKTYRMIGVQLSSNYQAPTEVIPMQSMIALFTRHSYIKEAKPISNKSDKKFRKKYFENSGSFEHLVPKMGWIFVISPFTLLLSCLRMAPL